MKSITDLPDQDLYPIIFRNLSINDLFNCRLVNKKFKYFSDHTNGIYELIIDQPYSFSYCYYNDKLIKNKEIISLKCFRLIKLLSIFNLDKNLKYLKIYDLELKLEELSNLINLESLELVYQFNNRDQQIINLKNLKVFICNRGLIKLNTPKLEKIQFNDISEIKLDSNPESIKHLIAENYDNKIKIFKNLEIIELRDIDRSINENLLIIFKNLKQLKINLSRFKIEYSNNKLRNALIKILNHKIKLRRDIDIYLEGVKIENVDKLNELRANEFPFWKFRLNNYDLLDLNLPFITQLYYNQLEAYTNNVRNDLPSSFFDKFQNINLIYVIRVNDIDGLNWVLKNVKSLKEFSIDSRVSLDQIFYNNLPDSIGFLQIYNKDNINYDFILKLSKLIRFHTNCNKDLFDLAFKSFLNLKYLKGFGFYFENKLISIKKDGENFYLNSAIEKLDYNQLIFECNKIRSK